MCLCCCVYVCTHHLVIVCFDFCVSNAVCSAIKIIIILFQYFFLEHLKNFRAMQTGMLDPERGGIEEAEIMIGSQNDTKVGLSVNLF